MTFEEILSPFVYGKKIRRSSWIEDVWIESNGDTVWQKALSRVEKGKIVTIKQYVNGDKVFSLYDVFADDWELYK